MSTHSIAVLVAALIALSAVPACAATAQIKPLNGAPALFINGEPANGLMFSSSPSPRPNVAEGQLRLANLPGHYAGRSVITTRSFPRDITLNVTLTVDKCTGSGANVALWLHETDKGSYFLSLNQVEGKNVLSLWKAGSGAFTFDKWITHPLDWKEEQPVDLALHVSGATLTLSANGERIGEVTDPAPLPAGPLKVSAYHSNSSVDALKVTLPDGSTEFEDDFSVAQSDVWPGLISGDAPGFEDVGFRIAMVDFRLDSLWKGPDELDLAALDSQVAGFVASNPGCLLSVRIRLNPPPWWVTAHPDDIATWHRLDGDQLEGKNDYASFSSPAWREETGKVLQQVLRRALDGPHADRFIGFNLLYAFGPEWEHPCTDAFWDFSPVNEEQFRLFLRTQYGTDDALAGAWSQPGVTLDTAAIPPAEDRVQGDFYELMDPARKGRRIADYYRFTDESVVEAIGIFADIIKAETQGNAYVLAHYGYHFEGYDGMDRINYNERGHHAIDRFLALPGIDGSGSAYQYRVRQAGGSTVPITTVASLRLHGKMYWLEDDTRTHLSSPTQNYGRASTLWESVNILKRNAAEALTQASPIWYLDFEGHWFSHPEIMKTVATAREMADRALTLDRSRNAEIAVIVNQRTVRHLRSSTALWLPVLCHEYFEQLPRIGAPFDSYIIDDLARDDMPEYKLYVMLDTFALGERERQLIREKVLRNDHTVLWHYAPGYITEDGLSDEAMSEIAGIKLTALDVGGVPRNTLCDLTHPMTRDCPPGLSWGTKLPIGPLITCTDPDVQVLGTQHAVPGSRPDGRIKMGDVFEPSLAVKQMDGWTSVWCGVPPAPSALLRNIARAAGVHIYDDAEDFVCANNVLLGVHTRYAGPRTIHLPRKCTVTDAFTGERLGEGIQTFEVQLRQYETRIWWMD